MMFGDMQHDGAGFEQHQIAFFIRGYLSERMQRAMGWLFHRCKRHEPNLVCLADFL
jgi:hypothetical protein